VSGSVVMLPYLAIVPGVSDTLERPTYGSDDTEDTRDPMTAAEDADRLNYTRGSGAWDAEDHVNREEEVPSAKEEINVIIQCLLLHVTVVDGSVPQQEGEWCDEDEVPDAGTEVAAAVFGANGKVYDGSDHVEEQCGTQDQPELKETSDQGAGCFWDLIRN